MLGKAEFMNGDFKAGFDNMIAAVKHGYEKMPDLLWLGAQLQKNKKTDDLVGFFQLLSQRDPAYLIYLALIYNDMGDQRQAGEIADQLLTYEDTHPGAHIGKEHYATLAELYRMWHDIKKRTRALERAGILAPF